MSSMSARVSDAIYAALCAQFGAEDGSTWVVVPGSDRATGSAGCARAAGAVESGTDVRPQAVAGGDGGPK